MRLQELISSAHEHSLPLKSLSTFWNSRNLSYGTVNLVLSQGKPKFEVQEVDPPKKDKWKNKKRFKMQKKREKEKRKAANRKDPRRLGITRKKKPKFANAEERIKYKLEKVSPHCFMFSLLYRLCNCLVTKTETVFRPS